MLKFKVPLATEACQRNVNGNMDSAKYQSDIGMTCECVVFLQKGYVLCMISRHAITLKVLEYSYTVK